MDGRTQRTIRNRKTIIEALLDLFSKGNLVPTAQQVADHSSLGIRSVFRHFSDMENLFLEADQLLHENYRLLPHVKPSGSLSMRIEQLVKERNSTYAAFAAPIRATISQMWRYPLMRKRYKVLGTNLKFETMYFLPELKQHANHVTESVDLIISFESYERLRKISDLSKKETSKVMVAALNTLLGVSN